MSLKLPGRLTFKVVSARNLIDKNGSGKASPACVITFEKQECRTAAKDGFSPTFGETFTFDVSAPKTEIIVTLVDKSIAKGDDFLGQVKIPIGGLQEGKPQESWFKLLPRKWKDETKGEIMLSLTYTSQSRAVSTDDFEMLKVLGKGSFGKVLQVRKKDSNRVYAMKIIKKDAVIARQEVEHTRSEQMVLSRTTHPYVVSLKYSFQTPEKLYLVLDFVNGGELFYHLSQEGSFPENRVKFYAAELILALEHLHKEGIIYRDLKTENILLDYHGHICLTDFGLCKMDMKQGDTTNTFCGTPEYLAPEVLKGEGYGHSVDWWSLGTLIFEMLTGLPPFYDENINIMYKQILEAPLEFPDEVSLEAKMLLQGMLTRDPKRRLGGGPEDAEPIKSHPWFADIDWEALSQRQVAAPWKPDVRSDTDVRNFDSSFTEEVVLDSVVEDSQLSQTQQDNFIGFSFVSQSLQNGGL